MKKETKIIKYICPKCQSIHWWAADHCWNKKCKYDKPLKKLQTKSIK